jgi:hypothetical protein
MREVVDQIRRASYRRRPLDESRYQDFTNSSKYRFAAALASPMQAHGTLNGRADVINTGDADLAGAESMGALRTV